MSARLSAWFYALFAYGINLEPELKVKTMQQTMPYLLAASGPKDVLAQLRLSQSKSNRVFLREEVLIGAFYVVYCWHSMRGFEEKAKIGYKAMVKQIEKEKKAKKEAKIKRREAMPAEELKKLEKREDKLNKIKAAVYMIPFGGSTLGGIKAELQGNKGLNCFTLLVDSLEFRLRTLKNKAAPWKEPKYDDSLTEKQKRKLRKQKIAEQDLKTLSELDRLVLKTSLYKEKHTKNGLKARKFYEFGVKQLREIFKMRKNGQKQDFSYWLETTSKIIDFTKEVFGDQDYHSNAELAVASLSGIVDMASLVFMGEVEPVMKELADEIQNEYKLLQYDPEKELDEFLKELGPELERMI